jgi:ABC-type multidrug transport system ATPase subunit
MQIALESLTKRFGSLRALENISLTIPPGQIVGILGPNGAGKTTLLRMSFRHRSPLAAAVTGDNESKE